jgi:hypothetical protein
MTAASLAALTALFPAVASAQAANTGTTFYGTLGYADTSLDHVNLGSIQGRIGARFGQHFGVEGEVAGGVKSDTVNVAGTDVKVKLDHQEAIYGVGFLPISPNIDLLARVGYGNTHVKASALGSSYSDSGDSWNYGVGGQYHFDAVNGVRADYTRQEFTGSNAGHADVWSVAYTRRF